MNNFALELYDDEGRFCTFYSVRKEGASTNETEKFWERFFESEKFGRSLNELIELVFTKIGDEWGAKKIFFREERNAEALPKSYVRLGNIEIKFPDFPLRLYCIRINDGLVVLFGGGEKTARTAQEGDTAKSFEDAIFFATKIDEAFANKDIMVSPDGRNIIDCLNGGTELIVV